MQIFKNIRLRTMVITGFAIMLVLTGGVGYIGYSGLSNVTDRKDELDNVQQLYSSILETRMQEKNFIIRGDKKYMDMVTEQVDILKEQASEVRDEFHDPVMIRQMDEVILSINRSLVSQRLIEQFQLDNIGGFLVFVS